MEQYKNSVLVPEMIIKLKQGFGRLIRRETDTGVVALLDCRVREDGPYRTRVLQALPNCRVTSDLEDVETFIQSKKGQDYFV
jgi:ATP-dependent DNA helicase DinG